MFASGVVRFNESVDLGTHEVYLGLRFSHRSKVQIKKASVKCGVGAALDLREQKLEAEGKESTIGRKKKN